MQESKFGFYQRKKSVSRVFDSLSTLPLGTHATRVLSHATRMEHATRVLSYAARVDLEQMQQLSVFALFFSVRIH